MKKFQLIIFFMVSVLVCCKSNQEKYIVFKCPKVINSQFTDSRKGTTFKASFVSEIFPAFAGKYKFQDEIDVNPKKRDTSFRKDYIYMDIQKLDLVIVLTLVVLI